MTIHAYKNAAVSALAITNSNSNSGDTILISQRTGQITAAPLALSPPAKPGTPNTMSPFCCLRAPSALWAKPKTQPPCNVGFALRVMRRTLLRAERYGDHTSPTALCANRACHLRHLSLLKLTKWTLTPLPLRKPCQLTA